MSGAAMTREIQNQADQGCDHESERKAPAPDWQTD
jgi:hypothetical protein